MINYEGIPSMDDKEFQLECLRENLAEFVYSEYPPFVDRLNSTKFNMVRDDNGRIILPYGPWSVDNHSNREKHDKEEVPCLQDQEMLQAMGFEIDSKGRPIHPWFYDMIEDPKIGVITGKGFYRRWGPNYTADPIILSKGHILLIQRKDTGAEALPGGFIDLLPSGEMEDPDIAARREAEEEARIIIPNDIIGKKVYQGVVADIRTSANAWADTTAILYELDDMIMPNGALDKKEVKKVEWFKIDDALQKHLFGSHKLLVEKALELQLNN